MVRMRPERKHTGRDIRSILTSEYNWISKSVVDIGIKLSTYCKAAKLNARKVLESLLRSSETRDLSVDCFGGAFIAFAVVVGQIVAAAPPIAGIPRGCREFWWDTGDSQ